MPRLKKEILVLALKNGTQKGGCRKKVYLLWYRSRIYPSFCCNLLVYRSSFLYDIPKNSKILQRSSVGQLGMPTDKLRI